MRLDVLLLLLYGIVLVLIILEFSSIWSLSIVLMIMLVISLVQKIYFDNSFESLTKGKDKLIEMITNRLDMFLNSIENIKIIIDKNVSDTQNKLEEIKNYNKEELEKKYDELVKKIIDVENKLNIVKRTLGAAYSAVDERLNTIENILNISAEEKRKN
ncbi:MAG: hypothetical protein QXD48_01830 [Candidatus Aenigmatarchaeota archaeon]